MVCKQGQFDVVVLCFLYQFECSTCAWNDSSINLNAQQVNGMTQVSI